MVMVVPHPRAAKRPQRNFMTNSRASQSGAPTILPGSAPKVTPAPIRTTSHRQWRPLRRPTRMPRLWLPRP
eukprot:2287070-Lingulodinium_polyedra.AAC.1